jgi:transposase
LAGEALKSQVELLISIKGVTPLIALAFLGDVADVRRFRTLRKMNAYLGLVPRAVGARVGLVTSLVNPGS